MYIRYQNFEAHYTNAGVLPTQVIKTYYPFYQYYFSLHNLLDTDFQQRALFLVHFLIALCLLIGYKTSLFTLLNYIFLLSLHHRNPMILQGGDDLLRITLFYMIFLPWGKHYSLDYYFKSKYFFKPKKDENEFSWFYLLFMWNVSFVYLFSALLKTEAEWRITGEALYYALNLETIRTSLGRMLLHYPEILKIASYFVYYVQEILAPLFLIFPLNRSIRNSAAILIILLHLFILLFLRVGIFPFVGITTALMLFGFLDKKQGQFSLPARLQCIAALMVFVLVVRFNLATLNTPYFSITIQEDNFMHSIGLSQRWNMFSPGVKRYDGYLILRGIKSDNTEWDLIHNSPKIHYEKNIQHSNYLYGDRWRKFLENYEQQHYNFVKHYFCYFIIRQWNQQHPDNAIEALNILFMKKTTLPNYKYKTELENLCLCNSWFEKP